MKNDTNQPQLPANPTVNRDAPVTGGKNQITYYDLQIRQPIRQKIDPARYLTYILAAENRYNPQRGQLYDAYTHAMLDGHLFGIINKRIEAVLNKPLFYKDKPGSIVQPMVDVIKSYEFRVIMRTILESILWGISAIEFIPGPALNPRVLPRKHICPKKQLITFEQYSTSTGIDYTQLSNVWVIGEDEDLGLLLSASLYAIYKRNALSDWANFVQIFGMPTRVAKYPVNDKPTQIALQDALNNSGSALSILIPKEAEFTLEDSKAGNANGDLQSQFVGIMDQNMSIVILGNTETTTNGKTGSQAKSKVHQDQQNELLKSDMALLQAYLNDPHFIAILNSYGLPVTTEGQFEFNKDIDINFLSLRAEVDKILVEAGVPIAAEYFYETYNIPAPKPSDTIVGQAEDDMEEEQDEEPDPTPNSPKKGATGPKKKKRPDAPKNINLQDLSDLIDQKLNSFFD